MSNDTIEDGKAVFLQPEKVGSSIRYRASFGGYGSKAWCEGEVNLTDCDRRICWHGEVEDLIVKIDAALAALTNARKAFVTAQLGKQKRAKIKVPK